jgi:hypothetical protein
MLYILNAFSLGMLPEGRKNHLWVTEISTETAANLVKIMSKMTNVVSAVGHKSTADLLTKLLGFEVAYNRVQVKLEKNDVALVFQLLTRLEEGRVLTEEELQNISYKFYLVEVG